MVRKRKQESAPPILLAVRERLDDPGKTFDEIARDVGVSRRWLFDVRGGQTDPGICRVYRLAEYLGIEP